VAEGWKPFRKIVGKVNFGKRRRHQKPPTETFDSPLITGKRPKTQQVFSIRRCHRQTPISEKSSFSAKIGGIGG